MQYQYQGQERSRSEGKTSYKNSPMAEVQTLAIPRGHESCRRMERYVALSFFFDVNFSTMPRPLLLSKLWPVRLISTRNSPQSRTFSCPMIHGGIDPVGVVRDRPLEM